MKRVALAVVGISTLLFIGSLSTASAADMPVKAPPTAVAPAPIFNWTGFYVGLDGGGAWARQDVFDVPCSTCATIPESGTLKGSGFIGGIYTGYNFLIAPRWLVGIEGDWSWTHLNDTTTAPQIVPPVVAGPPQINSWSRNVTWLASVRGRVGFTPSPSALLYVTGGAAWAGTDYSGQDIFVNGCGNCGLTSFSQTSSGYVIGAGGEWAPWANNWLLRVEYLYYHFNGANSSVGFQNLPAEFCCTFNWGGLSINEVRGGAAYKF